MKDSFFEWLDRVHLKIYKTVTKIEGISPYLLKIYRFVTIIIRQ